MLRGAGAGAEVCTKIEGYGVALARGGTGGCEFRVVYGRSPMLAKCWLTAARAALVIVSTNWCVVGGEKSSLRGADARDAGDPNAGVGVGSGRRGASRCTVLFPAIRGGNGGPVPSFGSGAWQKHDTCLRNWKSRSFPCGVFEPESLYEVRTVMSLLEFP